MRGEQPGRLRRLRGAELEAAAIPRRDETHRALAEGTLAVKQDDCRHNATIVESGNPHALPALTLLPTAPKTRRPLLTLLPTAPEVLRPLLLLRRQQRVNFTPRARSMNRQFDLRRRNLLRGGPALFLTERSHTHRFTRRLPRGL